MATIAPRTMMEAKTCAVVFGRLIAAQLSGGQVAAQLPALPHSIGIALQTHPASLQMNVAASHCTAIPATPKPSTTNIRAIVRTISTVTTSEAARKRDSAVQVREGPKGPTVFSF